MSIIWETKLDNRYDVRVTRTRPYFGELVVRDGGKVLLHREVGLSYDAKFGPDLDDLAQWEDIVIRLVDNQES